MSSYRAPSNRTFGLVFAAVFAVLAAIAWLLTGAPAAWAVAVSTAFLVTAVAVPGLLLPLNRLWGSLARRLGSVSNALLLGLFFTLVVVPAGLLMRIIGRDPMTRRRDAELPSYWTPVKRGLSPENLSDLF